MHAFAVDPRRGTLLLTILALAAGAGFALFAWRAPRLKDQAAFAPISRESALVLNNIFLAAVTFTVLAGTLAPLVWEAVSGTPNSVGAPYYNFTFGIVMSLALIVLPAGPLLAWKRGDIGGVLQRLRWAALAGIAAFLVCLAMVSPRNALASAGVALGAWVIVAAVDEAEAF